MRNRVKIGGVVPASGASTRMGTDDKLSLSLGGIPFLRRVVEALLGGGVQPVCVVAPAGMPERLGVLVGLEGVIPVLNPAPDRGMGHSVALGARALPPDVGGVAVMPGDLPFVDSGLVAGLAKRFAVSSRGILVPVHRGRRGHPVFFRRDRYGMQLAALEGEGGGRSVLAAHPGDVEAWPVDDPAVLLDVDTPADLVLARETWGREGYP